MTIKTVQEHINEADTIAKHIKDANALVDRLRDELDKARTTLHSLRDFAPADRFKIDPPYHLRKTGADGRPEGQNMIAIIKAQTTRINTLLGDRAE